jgi:hypothetical protein
MTFIPLMWTVWGVLAAIAAALYLYRSSLTRDEDDQIYLDDAFEHEKAAQEAIVAKVNKIEPLVKTALWLIAAATVFVIAYYVIDIARQFQ